MATTSEAPVKTQDLRIYKPTKNNTGAMSRWNYRGGWNDKDIPYGVVFLEMSPQKTEDSDDNRKFDYEKVIRVKLEANDMAAIAMFLSGRTPKCELYHETEVNGVKVVKVIKVSLHETYGFSIQVSVKEGEGEVRAIRHNLTDAEVYILVTLLQRAIITAYGW